MYLSMSRGRLQPGDLDKAAAAADAYPRDALRKGLGGAGLLSDQEGEQNP